MEPRKTSEQASAAWVIEPAYTTAQFWIRNLGMFTVRGSFGDITGTIVRDDVDIKRSWVEATIKAATVATRNERRDSHLRSASFLDVAEFPEIGYKSTSVERGTDRDMLRIKGLLTIRGKSREVTLDVTEVDHSRSPQGADVAYYTAVTRIDRFDFGVRYGLGLIGRTVNIRIHVQALRYGSGPGK